MSIRAQYATMKQVMTPAPRSIGVDQPLGAAVRLMKEQGFRHLPVLDGGDCVGIITDRDLALLESIREVNPETLSVEELMTPDPWVVSPDDKLQTVAKTMKERRYGAAVVMDKGKVTGIFTTVDALRVLSELLEEEGGLAAAK